MACPYTNTHVSTTIVDTLIPSLTLMGIVGTGVSLSEPPKHNIIVNIYNQSLIDHVHLSEAT